MKSVYVSPSDRSDLRLVNKNYVDIQGNKFTIKDGIPNFIYPRELPGGNPP